MVVGAWVLVAGLQLRESPTTIEGLRFEVMPATVHEDLVLEVTGRLPLIVSNRSRRPRTIFALEGLALVAAGRAHYTATVTTVDEWEALDGRRLILNPGATALGDVWVTLPAGEAPRKVTLRQLRPHSRAIHARFPRMNPIGDRSLGRLDA